MTYKETLSYLFTQLPMFQREGSMAFKKDMTNILALLKYLDNPHLQFRSIHVAGTNGKGSVSHLLSAALQSGGFKTGLYTSPHYKDFRERVKIDGNYISKKAVVRFVEKIKPFLKEVQASFFEITVAMAFDYFAEQKVDLAIIEVGLGGRLDSTNVLLPELSIITNIGLDHQQFLGDTLPLIAAEKAGIIKPNVPVVVGQTQKETAPVFRKKALEKGAPLYFADQHFQVIPIKETLQYTEYKIFRDQQLYTPSLAIEWNGPYQYLNVQTTLMALEVWQKHAKPGNRFLPFGALENGWKALKKLSKFQGRWQILGNNPLILVDSAHNEDGLKAILPALVKQSQYQLHIILGVVTDKDLDKVLPLFPVNATYYFAKAAIPRGLPAKTLQSNAKKHRLYGRAYISIKNALKAAKRNAETDDTIFIGGSIFTVAEVL